MSDPTEVGPEVSFPLFYDSAAGPDGTPVWPQPQPERVMLYADRTPPQTAGMAGGSAHHWITLEGEGHWQALAGDYEPATVLYERPGRMRKWVDKRISNLGRAVAYCDRANLHQLHDELGPTLFRHPSLWFWIPTLDGRKWTPLELSQNIAQYWSVVIPPERLWACQFEGGLGWDWDTSLLYGPWVG
jgi:hypothetical protein